MSLPVVPIAAALAILGGGYLYYSRSQSAAGVAARAAGMPRYDTSLPDAIADKIDVMLGRIAGKPGETDPAKVRAFAATINASTYPIASNALNLYAASLGPKPTYEFPADFPASSSSSSSSSGGGIFGGGILAGLGRVRVTDVKSAQSALVNWNSATGMGGDFGQTATSDVDGIAGPRSNKAAAAFVAWLASVGGPVTPATFSTPLYAQLENYANGGAVAASSTPSPSPSPALKIPISKNLLNSIVLNAPKPSPAAASTPAIKLGPPLPPNPRRPGSAVASPAPVVQTLLGSKPLL